MIYRIIVTYKPVVSDPEGQVIKSALIKKGYKFIENVRVGKIFDITVNNRDDATDEIEKLSKEILVNPIVEEFKVEILKENS